MRAGINPRKIIPTAEMNTEMPIAKDHTEPTRLSIAIPVYNERDSWRELLRRVESVELPGVVRQFILVDDGSSDGTGEQMRELAG